MRYGLLKLEKVKNPHKYKRILHVNQTVIHVFQTHARAYKRYMTVEGRE